MREREREREGEGEGGGGGERERGVCNVYLLHSCIQVLHHDSVFVLKSRDREEETPFLPQESVVKWNKKSTPIKIQVS